jgi:hypothetical protein
LLPVNLLLLVVVLLLVVLVVLVVLLVLVLPMVPSPCGPAIITMDPKPNTDTTSESAASSSSMRPN